MQNLVNKNIDRWKHPWNVEKFDNLFDRDERYFSILIKGALSWLTRNIVLYDKPINHFIFNTGSSYIYVESNGYKYSLNEVSGEDQVYMKMPRCIVEIDNVSIPLEELTQPYVVGTYERMIGNEIVGMNAEMRRLPIEVSLKLRYVLSNFNESIVLLQEIIDKLVFNKYFRITYLGQTIKCSLDWPTEQSIEVNKIDMSSSDTNQKSIEFSLKVTSSYPQIDERTECKNSDIIGKFGTETCLHPKSLSNKSSDKEYNTFE